MKLFGVKWLRGATKLWYNISLSSVCLCVRSKKLEVKKAKMDFAECLARLFGWI